MTGVSRRSNNIQIFVAEIGSESSLDKKILPLHFSFSVKVLFRLLVFVTYIRPFLRVNRGGNCPRSEIKCPHSEHGKQETGGGGQRQIACPSRTIPRTDVSTCYHAPADHIQGSPSIAEIPNL